MTHLLKTTLLQGSPMSTSSHILIVDLFKSFFFLILDCLRNSNVLDTQKRREVEDSVSFGTLILILIIIWVNGGSRDWPRGEWENGIGIWPDSGPDLPGMRVTNSECLYISCRR